MKPEKDSFNDFIDGFSLWVIHFSTSYIKFSAVSVIESCYIIIAEIFWQPKGRRVEEESGGPGILLCLCLCVGLLGLP